MKYWQLIGYVGAAFLGYLIALELDLVLKLLLYFFYFSFGGGIQGINPGVFIIESFVVLAVGVLAGVRFFYKRKDLAPVFRPDKNKVLYSLLISLMFVLLPLASLSQETLSIYVTLVHPLELVARIVLSILMNSVIFYPFACLAMYLNRTRGNKAIPRRRFFAFALLINPIFIVIASSVNFSVAVAIYSEPCGVTYQGFLPDSAARDAGMLPQEIITKVNGITIRTINEFVIILDKIPGNTTIVFETVEGKVYELLRRYNEREDRYMIGIAFVSTALCPKEFDSQ